MTNAIEMNVFDVGGNVLKFSIWLCLKYGHAYIHVYFVHDSALHYIYSSLLLKKKN